ncbi:MAG: glycosyltransferase [Bacteroidetes bacterium]|nr:glycosyltransferase [Bacteroidota bacterium]
MKIHLHCFSYGRAPSQELAALCEKVFYYPRKTGLFSNFSSLPYTVKSRQSKELEKNLLANDYPILFEVLHTCYLLNDERFKNRIKIYRHSNIEHLYYQHLASAEKNFIKRIYLKLEAKKLEKFEHVLFNANYILAVNEEDAQYFRKRYPQPKTIYLPSFHANSSIDIKTGKGDFILYHGNLSVSENYKAAEWLIDKVLSKIDNPAVIAGLNPPGFLKLKVSKHKNIRLIENPSNDAMDNLLEKAQLHCLHTSQGTGLKLKLLNVLYKGRFILCNQKMLEGTGIKENETLTICNSPEEYLSSIKRLMTAEFTEKLITQRKDSVQAFDNEKNIQTLVSLL